MLFLILTIFSSTSIGLFLKYSNKKGDNSIILILGNYITASLLSLLFFVTNPDAQFSLQTIGLGALMAVVFVYGFFAFAKTVDVAGTALAVVSSRLSVVIPVIFSILLFGESPNLFQMLGFLFVLVTIISFYLSLKRLPAGNIKGIDFFYLFAVLASIGLADFGLKVFQQLRPIAEKAAFLSSIFSFALLFTFIVAVAKKIEFKKATLLRGTILGIPNIFSSFFLINALTQLPAILAYPILNIGIILLTTFAAALLFKEKLNVYGVVAVVTGIITVVMLSMS